jgi:hypothetical protein
MPEDCFRIVHAPLTEVQQSRFLFGKLEGFTNRKVLKNIKYWEKRLGQTMEEILDGTAKEKSKAIGVAMKFATAHAELSQKEKASLWSALAATIAVYMGMPPQYFQVQFKDPRSKSIIFQGRRIPGKVYPTFMITRDGRTYFGKTQIISKRMLSTYPTETDLKPITLDYK